MEICRKGGFSDATSYKWRAKFGGMEASDAKRLRELEVDADREHPLAARVAAAYVILERLPNGLR